MRNYALDKVISQVKRDQRNKSGRSRYDFELAYNKIFVSGDRGQIITIINYQFPVVYDFKGNGGRINKSFYEFGGDEMIDEKIRKRTVNKIRTNLHDLANDNFTRGDKFVTFVHADQVLDLKVSNEYFDRFVKRLKYHENGGAPFSYLAGIEFKQKNRDCIHYHVLWNLPYIKQKKLLQYWGKGRGSVFVRRIYHVNNLGDYLLKYIGKGISDRRFEGQKAYLCSKNLIRKKGRYASDDEVNGIIRSKGLGSKNMTFSSKYETENYGWRTKTEYNLEKNRR